MSSRALRASFLPLLASCSLIACGGGDAPPQSGAETPADEAPAAVTTDIAQNACDHVSLEDVVRITGVEATTGAESVSGQARVCTWTDMSGSAVLQLYPTAESYDMIRTAFEDLYGGTAESIGGVGNAAFYLSGVTGPFPTAAVAARKGGASVSVHVMGMSREASALREAALALLRLAVDKL